MALVTLNSINVEKGIGPSDYAEIILYPLMTDAGPSGYTLVNSLEELRIMFTPTVTTPNWLYAETLVNLGYRLLVAKLVDSEDYLSLRIFESYEKEIPIVVKETEVEGETGELGMTPVHKETEVLESEKKVIPRVVSYPKRYHNYEKMSISWENWNQLSVDPGESYSYAFKLYIPDDIKKGDYAYFIVRADNLLFKSNTRSYLLAFGESVDFNNIASNSYSEVIYIPLYKEGSADPRDIKDIKRDIISKMSSWGFYVLEKEEEILSKSNAYVDFFSFSPVQNNTSCKFGDSYKTILKNKAGNWDIICAAYDDRKLVDFYSRDLLSSDNIKIDIVKNFDGKYSLYIDVYTYSSNNKHKISEKIDSEYFRVSLDRTDTKFFIEDVLREKSKYLDCYLYKEGDISGSYNLKNRLDTKSVNRTEMLETFKSLDVLDEGDFDIIVNPDLGEEFRKYLQKTYENHFCLKFFQLENVEDIKTESGDLIKKAVLPDTKYETNGITYFTGYPISGVVMYPLWIALLAKVKLDGAFAGEIFPQSSAIFSYDKKEEDEHGNVNTTKVPIELEESKYICDLIFDGYRYFIPSVPVKFDNKIFSIDLLWVTTVVRNRIIPSINPNLAADDFIKEFNAKVRRFMNGKDTRISSIVISGYKRVDRNLMLEIEVIHDDKFVDSILLDVVIKIN